MKRVDAGVIYDPDDVQIRSSCATVKNRIGSFMKRKRDDSDERSVRMYCNSTYGDGHCGSSRTRNTIAVKRQKGSECYVEWKKANNVTGPQCDGIDPSSENSYNLSLDYSFSDTSKPDIQERISNVERCLNFKTNNDMNIYEKLKSLEDYVLKIEQTLLNNGICLQNIHPNEEFINHRLNTNDDGVQGNCVTNDNIVNNLKNQNNPNMIVKEDNNPTKSDVMPKISKYSVYEIKKLIKDFQAIEDKKKIAF